MARATIVSAFQRISEASRSSMARSPGYGGCAWAGMVLIGLPHWQLLPVLLLTFMFGPAGLLTFFVLRALRRPASLSFANGAR